MRGERELFDLILTVAREDQRVRGVWLNGSRANPQVPEDRWRDYDIVYLVREMDSFLADHSWIDVFGERWMLQMPETMRDPLGDGRFTYLILLADGNRIDLTLIPADRPGLLGEDSLTVPLLDKDGIFPAFPESSDRDYWVKKPDKLGFSSCCNNFWWCIQNVAKGLVRGELPYAMKMYHTVVREGLHDMLDWYIGGAAAFQVSPGKWGKFYRRYLPEEYYAQYEKTFSGPGFAETWEAMEEMCRLFAAVAPQVGEQLGYPYRKDEEEGMKRYLQWLKRGGM